MTGVSRAWLNEHFSSAALAGSESVGAERAYLQAGTAGEEAFSAVFESSGEALVLTDSSGVIHQANRRAQYLLGVPESAVHGVNLGTLLAKESGSEVLSLYASAKASKLARIGVMLATGRPLGISARAILPGSSALLLCLEEALAPPCAANKWWQVSPELRSVFDSVLTGIIVFDAAGCVRFSNAAINEIFGLSAPSLRQAKTAEELRDVLAERFPNPETSSAFRPAFPQGENDPNLEELEIFRPERRVIERFARPVVAADGRKVGWVELYADVTYERQVNSKMVQTEKMAALGQLVSGIAHELNNPLTAVMGYAQLLLGEGLAPAQLAKARRVYQQAERARRIVKNLLYFARENKPERSHVNVNEVIRRTVSLRSYELKVKNIAVHCELARSLPQTMADPYQLQQVILNLLINAEQALTEGRGYGHVWIRTRRPSRRAGSRIAMEIVDDGPGIPPEIANRIFDPFFTTKPPGVGTGLGLSIVYGIVQQHGGEVSFESQLGHGTKFVVELPVVNTPMETVRGSLLLPMDGMDQESKGRILTVEDEPTVAQLIVDVLQEEGHQVEAVLDGKEALARLSEASYDLVICDLRMPGLSGPAFYDTLVRERSPMQHRILFITGDILSPWSREFLEPRKLPHLAKPFLVGELKLAVKRMLEELRQAGTSRTGDKGSMEMK